MLIDIIDQFINNSNVLLLKINIFGSQPKSILPLASIVSSFICNISDNV